MCLYVLLSGRFPFARLEDRYEKNVTKLQRMFSRAMCAQYPPLPQVRACPSQANSVHRALTPCCTGFRHCTWLDNVSCLLKRCAWYEYCHTRSTARL